jgi:hypothetical protein
MLRLVHVCDSVVHISVYGGENMGVPELDVLSGLVLSPATLDLIGCSMTYILSVLLDPGVSGMPYLPNKYLITLTGDAVCFWCFQPWVIIGWWKETASVVKGQPDK